MIATVYGARVRVCNPGCRDAFRSDRQHRLIYPPTWDEQGKKWLGTEEASLAFLHCVYCNASVRGRRILQAAQEREG